MDSYVVRIFDQNSVPQNKLILRSRTALTRWITEHASVTPHFSVEPAKLDNLSVANELVDAIRILSDGVRSYNELNEDERKAVRHILYQRQGNRAKALTPIFEKLG